MKYMLDYAQDLFKAETDYLKALIEIYDKLGWQNISFKEFAIGALTVVLQSVEASDEIYTRYKEDFS